MTNNDATRKPPAAEAGSRDKPVNWRAIQAT
jgi:hypothetical protein